MSRNFLVALSFSAVALLASPSRAITLDFVSLASGNEHSFASETFSNIDGSGISATVTARDLTDVTGPFSSAPPYGYLDDLFNGGDGGLGVCQTVNCAGSPDDNISLGEVAIIEFDQVVTITSILFSNGIHVDVYNGSLGIHVGATNPSTAETFNNLFTAAGVINTSLTGNRFSFVADESFAGGGTGDPSRLYVSAITFVPEPSTSLLVGAGLAGLAALRRSGRARA